MPEPTPPAPGEPPPGPQPGVPARDHPGFWQRIQVQLQRGGFWRTACLLLVAAFILVVVRPFGSTPPLMTSVEVIAAWNESIARLGIQAVYPPQEDFRVGDVLAIVGASDGKALLGKSVLVGRIPLGTFILQADKDRPIFADTAEPASGQTMRKLGRVEIDVPQAETNKIATAIAAFPAITLNHTTKSALGAAAEWVGISGARDGQRYEQINILSVESYSAPPLEAAGALDLWCEAKETKVLCEDDALARKMLAMTVSPNVLDTKDGKYINEIELQLVTRVFMTREIRTRRWVTDSSGTVVAIAGDGKAATPASTATPAPGTGGNTGAPAAPPDTAGGKLATQWLNETDMGLSGVFQRPVAFGYRSVRIKLKPSTPPPPEPQQTTSAHRETPK